MRARFLTIVAAAVALAALATNAQAQSLQGLMQQNMEFDRQFDQRLGQLQQQNAQSQQQLWQSYLQQNGPWLHQQYDAYRAAGQMPYTFEQFAYYMLTTANGTNVQGALDAQNDRFRRQQDAARTRQEGYDDYNAGARRNSEATDRTLNNYDQQAVRGNAPYVDPSTGGTRWLPYSQTPGQVFNDGRNSYVQDRQGTYYQWQGNGWVEMQPGQQ